MPSLPRPVRRAGQADVVGRPVLHLPDGGKWFDALCWQCPLWCGQLTLLPVEDVMRFRAPIAVVGTAAAALGLTAAIVVPAAAGARAVTHTLRFTAVQQSRVNYSKTDNATADKDVNQAGKTVGFDMLHFTLGPGGAARLSVVVNTAGGFLYGKLAATSGRVEHGTVTGGTGKFSGAKGTITATPANSAGTRTNVVITYHT
jgi:hypothetical protein